ncbi:MAG: hypothetical protein M3P28_07660 [Thermoproteota archaeon]|nr:hypothetical protein [Thermoproteota archaeon]
MERLEKSSMGVMESAIKDLAMENTLEAIDKARKELENTLPRNIVDKFKDSY